MEPKTEKIIKEMSAIIVEAVNPKKIILFGSQARGTSRPDSDLDFLIVQDQPFSPASTRRQQMAKLWRLLAHFPVSQDLVVFTEEEVEKWRHARNHVIARALREGKVVYERH